MTQIQMQSHSEMLRRSLALIAVVTVLAAIPQVVVLAAARPLAGPAHADEQLHISRTTASEDGLYVATLLIPKPVRFDDWSAWYLRIGDGSGSAVHDARVKIAGSNPASGEQLPGSIRVSYTHYDRYRIDGVRVRSPGIWVITATVDGLPGADSLLFAVDLR